MKELPGRGRSRTETRVRGRTEREPRRQSHDGVRAPSAASCWSPHHGSSAQTALMNGRCSSRACLGLKIGCAPWSGTHRRRRAGGHHSWHRRRGVTSLGATYPPQPYRRIRSAFRRRHRSVFSSAQWVFNFDQLQEGGGKSWRCSGGGRGRSWCDHRAKVDRRIGHCRVCGSVVL